MAPCEIVNDTSHGAGAVVEGYIFMRLFLYNNPVFRSNFVQENKRSTFLWLNATQALGVFNDNLYKLLVIAYLIGVEGQLSAGKITATAGAIFTLPFLLFSAYAGKLADRFSKSKITVILKFTEIAIMLTGIFAFYTGQNLCFMPLCSL